MTQDEGLYVQSLLMKIKQLEMDVWEGREQYKLQCRRKWEAEDKLAKANKTIEFHISHEYLYITRIKQLEQVLGSLTSQNLEGVSND